MVAITPNRVRFTDEQRIEALARIEAGESQHRISQEMGISQPAISKWRKHALEEAAKADNRVIAKVEPIDWTNAYIEASALGARIIRQNFERYDGKELSPRDLQSVAIVAGISTDKALDLRDGRKGTQINVDARSVQLPPGLTVDELRALALGSGPTLELPQGDVTDTNGPST